MAQVFTSPSQEPRAIIENRLDVEEYNKFVEGQQEELNKRLAFQQAERQKQLEAQEKQRQQKSLAREKKFAFFETEPFLSKRTQAKRQQVEVGRSSRLAEQASRDVQRFAEQEAERVRQEVEAAKPRFVKSMVVGFEQRAAPTEIVPTAELSGAPEKAFYKGQEGTYDRETGVFTSKTGEKFSTIYLDRPATPQEQAAYEQKLRSTGGYYLTKKGEGFTSIKTPAELKATTIFGGTKEKVSLVKPAGGVSSKLVSEYTRGKEIFPQTVKISNVSKNPFEKPYGVQKQIVGEARANIFTQLRTQQRQAEEAQQRYLNEKIKVKDLINAQGSPLQEARKTAGLEAEQARQRGLFGTGLFGGVSGAATALTSFSEELGGRGNVAAYINGLNKDVEFVLRAKQLNPNSPDYVFKAAQLGQEINQFGQRTKFKTIEQLRQENVAKYETITQEELMEGTGLAYESGKLIAGTAKYFIPGGAIASSVLDISAEKTKGEAVVTGTFLFGGYAIGKGVKGLTKALGIGKKALKEPTADEILKAISKQQIIGTPKTIAEIKGDKLFAETVFKVKTGRKLFEVSAVSESKIVDFAKKTSYDKFLALKGFASKKVLPEKATKIYLRLPESKKLLLLPEKAGQVFKQETGLVLKDSKLIKLGKKASSGDFRDIVKPTNKVGEVFLTQEIGFVRAREIGFVEKAVGRFRKPPGFVKEVKAGIEKGLKEKKVSTTNLDSISLTSVFDREISKSSKGFNESTRTGSYKQKMLDILRLKKTDTPLIEEVSRNYATELKNLSNLEKQAKKTADIAEAFPSLRNVLRETKARPIKTLTSLVRGKGVGETLGEAGIAQDTSRPYIILNKTLFGKRKKEVLYHEFGHFFEKGDFEELKQLNKDFLKLATTKKGGIKKGKELFYNEQSRILDYPAEQYVSEKFASFIGEFPMEVLKPTTPTGYKVNRFLGDFIKESIEAKKRIPSIFSGAKPPTEFINFVKQKTKQEGAKILKEKESFAIRGTKGQTISRQLINKDLELITPLQSYKTQSLTGKLFKKPITFLRTKIKDYPEFQAIVKETKAPFKKGFKGKGLKKEPSLDKSIKLSGKENVLKRLSPGQETKFLPKEDFTPPTVGDNVLDNVLTKLSKPTKKTSISSAQSKQIISNTQSQIVKSGQANVAKIQFKSNQQSKSFLDTQQGSIGLAKGGAATLTLQKPVTAKVTQKPKMDEFLKTDLKYSYPRPSMVSRLKDKSSTAFLIGIKNIEKQKQGSSFTFTLQKQSEKEIQKIRQSFFPTQAPKQQFKQGTGFKQAFGQAQIQTQTRQQKQIQKTNQPYPTITRTGFPYPLITPKPKRFIFPKRPIAEKFSERYVKENEAFDVFVRKKGKLELVGKSLPKRSALLKGLSIAEKTTQRTAILKRAGTTKLKDIPYLPLGLTQRFRLPTIKSSLRRAGETVLVEKTGYAISSLEEKLGIPGKAARLKRAKLI